VGGLFPLMNRVREGYEVSFPITCHSLLNLLLQQILMRLQTNSSPTIHHTSLRDVLATKRYKACLLDQFGVLHDGQKPYGQFNIDAVKQMKEEWGMKVLILSNSSRRSNGTIPKLEKLGYKEEWFDGAITSGEVAWQHLSERPGEEWSSLGRTALHFTWSKRGKISLESLDLEVTQDPMKATFVLAHGTEGLGADSKGGPVTLLTPESMREVLKVAASRNLPFVLANPDLVTVDGPGSLAMMPGTLAKWYQEDGGSDIRVMGKPGGVIYRLALNQLAVDPSEVLAIGDSLEHDILGASLAGVDSLFIAGGIASSELNFKGDREGSSATYDQEALAQLCRDLGVQSPTYSIPYLA
jgi:HAD superfamily hydrolase (TIGR01459 family)